VRFALEADAARLDTRRVIEYVTAHRAGAAAWHALSLATELAGARPPTLLVDALRPSAPRRAVYSMAWNLPAVRRLEAPAAAQQLEAPAFYLLEMGSPLDKLRYLADVAREAGGPVALLRRLKTMTRELLSSRRPARTASPAMTISEVPLE